MARRTSYRSRSGAAEVARLVADFGKMDTTLRRLIRPALKRAAQPMLADAKRRAAWSTRIPGAIRISTSLSGPRAGVSIRVDSKKAPHARPFEGITDRRDSFRHPVFGDREVWVTQKDRPFLAPAAEAGMPRATEEIARAVDYMAKLHGFR